ncbi:MAG: hypothetical protein Q8Q41_01215 [bacterium]|nr:hypothetical protein [bacterium]
MHDILVYGNPSKLFFDLINERKRKEGQGIAILLAEKRPDISPTISVAKRFLGIGVEVTVISFNMISFCMERKMISAAYLFYHSLGEDTISSDIGSRIVAISAREHGIPLFLYPSASTKKGKNGGKEEDDIRRFMGYPIAPETINTFTPLVEEVPWRYVSSVCLRNGIIIKEEALKDFLKKKYGRKGKRGEEEGNKGKDCQGLSRSL